jgi:hypothetical protein
MGAAKNDVYPWARLMLRMYARACVISQLTGLSALDTRNLWRDVIGGSSPSGQQPNDLAWYLKTPQRRSHAALLLVLYDQSKQKLPGYAAYAHAFYHYARMTASPSESHMWLESGDPAFRGSERDYVIPFSRGHFLVHMFTNELMMSGARKCELIIQQCGKCGGLYLKHQNEAGRYCPTCTKE